MKRLLLSLLITLVLIAAFIYWQYVTAKSYLTYKVNRTELVQGQPGTVTLNIYVDLYNPTLFALTVDSLTGTVALNQSIVGTAVIDKPQKINARATSTIVTSLAVNVKEVWNTNNLSSLINGSIDFNGLLAFTVLGLTYKDFPVSFSSTVKSFL